MPLRDQLSDDLREAMRARDETARDVIRYVNSAINNAEMEAKKRLYDTHADADGNISAEAQAEVEGFHLSDAEVLAVVQKQVKQRRDSIDAFQKGNRPDLVAREQAELAVLERYLPAQMSREDVEAEARKTIAETGASGPADKGKVMKPLTAALKDRADGRLINEVVTQLLAGNA
jgi:uncharacterized protein YqeY